MNPRTRAQRMMVAIPIVEHGQRRLRQRARGLCRGSVDPGLLLWLLEGNRVGTGEMSEALEHEAGLAGLAGSADPREILARAGRDEPDARLALDVYVHHLRAGIAAMTAALGGLDVLGFTGGVGEHAAAIRAEAAEHLIMLGVAIDPATNAAAHGDDVLSRPGPPVQTVVVRAREDLEIARQARDVLSREREAGA